MDGNQKDLDLDDTDPFSYFKGMHRHFFIITFLVSAVTLQAEPATEIKTFEAQTDTLSKKEIRDYMGRGPDEEITPHVWRYRGSWTNSETFEKFNTVDLAFGMLTDSHKYGVTRYIWDNTTESADDLP